MGDKVFVNGKAAVHKGSAGKSTAAPDVCLCPPGPPSGPVPTPLTNTVVARDLDDGATTVLIEGNPAGTRRSFFRKSTGNEVARATGGGILTGTVQGKAHFRFGYSRNVFFEGEPAVRHGDPLTHNHAAFPGNTPPAPWTSRMDPALPRKRPKTTVRILSEGKHWVEVVVLDEAGRPVSGTRYQLRTPSGAVIEGSLLGGGIAGARGLAKGPCRVTFPDVDERCEQVGWRDAPRAGRGQVAYRAGTPVVVETGKRHVVVVPAMVSLWVDLPIRADDAATRDDRFILRSDDGSYDVARTVKDDRVREDEGVTLEFPAVRKGLSYSLLHDLGADGATYAFFEGRTFEDLFPADAVETDQPDDAREVPLLSAAVDPDVVYLTEDFDDDSDLPPSKGDV